MWDTGDNTTTTIVSPTSTTTYVVTVTDSDGCEGTDEVEIVVNINTSADAGDDENICSGESITLTASGGVDYDWDTGDNDPSITVSPNVTTTYTVTVTDSNDCTDTDEVTVGIDDLPTIAASWDPNTICPGQTLFLMESGNDADEWDWEGPDGFDSTDQNPTLIATVDSDGEYSVTVTDNNGCTNSVSFQVAEGNCDCEITAGNLTGITCNDNGTPSDASDDFIEFTLDPSSVFGGSGYLVSASAGTITPASANYGNATTFQLQSGSAGSGNITIVIEDVDDSGCELDVTIMDPGTCSGTCNISSANLANVNCSDGGTSSNPIDDSITFTLDPQATNGASDYTVTVSGGVTIVPASGAFGAPTAFELGAGSAGAGNVMLTITDMNDPTCTIDVTLTDPGNCSNVCTISAAMLSSISCNDGGTGSDTSDDFITFTLDPQVMNGSASYNLSTATGTLSPTTAMYGSSSSFQLQPGSAGGGNVIVTLVDANNPACTIDIPITDPGNCSGSCNITAPVLEALSCNDGGTASDATDDFISFTLNPTVVNGGATYSVTVDGGTTIIPSMGTYGVATSFQLPAGAGNMSLTLTDTADPACTINVMVQDPGTCSGSCNLSSITATNVFCDDNGTLMNDSDDVITFEINPIGNNLGATYLLTSSAGVVTPGNGTYGSPSNFFLQAGTAGAGDVTVTITDVQDPNCTIDVIIPDPGTCSDCSTPPTVSLTLPQTGICQGDIPIQLGGNQPPGGIFSGTGVTGDIFDPAGLPPGNYPITYTVIENGCTAQAEDVITLFAQPVVTLDPATLIVCTPAITLNGGMPLGGSYSGPGVMGNIFDSDAVGIGIHRITYSFTDFASGCTGFAMQSIEVIEELQCDDGDCSNGIEEWDTATCSCITTPSVLGCTNSTATNFDPNATCDDGTCDFPCPDPGTCDNGECADGEEIWDGNICDCVAINVPNPATCMEDGDCTNGFDIWDPAICTCVNTPQISGCTDPTANNYDPNANCDDGSCDTTCPDPGTCDDGDCTNGEEIWNTTICDCEIINVPNPNACVDDGDCSNGEEVFNTMTCLCESINPPDPSTCVDDGDCTNGAEEWEPTSCTCVSVPEALGCTMPGALNFDPNATCDDGSCMYDCPALELNIGDPCNDQNPDTINDAIDANCECNGTINCDIQSVIEMPCDDMIACTINDVALVLSDGTECEPCLGEPVDCSQTNQVIIRPCDDQNEFTTDDQETVLACDTTEICVPCQGSSLPEVSVYLPNAIMVGDSQNGFFGPLTAEGRTILVEAFTIYDRWGEAVHKVDNISSDDPAVFWDGTFNGGMVEQGVYVYTLSFRQGNRNVLESGTLTVIRQ